MTSPAGQISGDVLMKAGNHQSWTWHNRYEMTFLLIGSAGFLTLGAGQLYQHGERVQVWRVLSGSGRPLLGVIVQFTYYVRNTFGPGM